MQSTSKLAMPGFIMHHQGRIPQVLALKPETCLGIYQAGHQVPGLPAQDWGQMG